VTKVRRIAAIGLLANIFEWYDFSIYAFLAGIIAHLFFASQNIHIALIKTFFIFSASYFVRPIGSLFFGYMADTYGVKKSLRTSLLMMSVPTVLLGVLPTYESVGYMATALLIVLRLFQGFAAGGELPCSAVYVYEASPAKFRGLFSSFVASSSMLGVLLGSLTVGGLYWIFPEKILLAWAWRIPFLIGFLLTIGILLIRRGIANTDASQDAQCKTPFLTLIKTLIKTHPLQLTQVFLLNAFISIAFYLLFVWMPVYLHMFLHVTAQKAFISNTIAMLCLIALTMVFGYYSAKIGKRPLALISIIGVFIAAYPLFLLFKTKILIVIIAVQIIFALLLSCVDGINMMLITGLFNKPVRCSGASIAFTLSTAIFGGAAPTISSYLIHRTGSMTSPVILLMAACLIALPAALSLPRQ
jgi:MFS transporter, MHS family, proline/betaine transporter